MRVLYQESAAPVVPPPQTVTADTWFRPLAEPVAAMLRWRPGLAGPAAAYAAPVVPASVAVAATAADRVLRSPGRRRLLAAPQRIRKLP